MFSLVPNCSTVSSSVMQRVPLDPMANTNKIKLILNRVTTILHWHPERPVIGLAALASCGTGVEMPG